MREYDSGAEISEEEFVITHSHSLFAAVAPLAVSEFKKTLENRILVCGLNKDAVMGELPSPTSEIVCERPLYLLVSGVAAASTSPATSIRVKCTPRAVPDR
jgi:hypothetical protein